MAMGQNEILASGTSSTTANDTGRNHSPRRETASQHQRDNERAATSNTQAVKYLSMSFGVRKPCLSEARNPRNARKNFCGKQAAQNDGKEGRKSQHYGQHLVV